MSGQARHSLDEQAAASAVASLSTAFKRQREEEKDPQAEVELKKAPKIRRTVASLKPSSNEDTSTEVRELRPAPFFYYRDYSQVEDDDPLAPLTPPGRVPNFPAKMHAILSRPDFSSIIAWALHGRAFRVLKPRQFEVRVIPTYFEHSKFSSYVRQANGWGFRRITQGPDRNCYYHEMFLRGMPYLCKKMKRPGASGKLSADPDHEPDLYKISEMFPIGDSAGGVADNQAILLQCTVEGGPKARMPVHMGLQLPPSAVAQLSPYDPSEAITDLSMEEDDCKVAAKEDPVPAVATAHPVLAPKPPQAGKPAASSGTTSVSLPLCGASFPSSKHSQGFDDLKIAAKKPSPAMKASMVVQPHVPNQPAAVPAPSNREELYQPAAAAAPLPQPSLGMSPVYAASLAIQQQQQLSQKLAATQQAQAAVQAQAAALASEIAGKMRPNPPAPQAPQVAHDPMGASQFAAGFAAAAALSSNAIQAVLHQALAGAAPFASQAHMAQFSSQSSQSAMGGLHSQMASAQSQAQVAYPYTNFQQLGLPPKDPPR